VLRASLTSSLAFTASSSELMRHCVRTRLVGRERTCTWRGHRMCRDGPRFGFPCDIHHTVQRPFGSGSAVPQLLRHNEGAIYSQAACRDAITAQRSAQSVGELSTLASCRHKTSLFPAKALIVSYLLITGTELQGIHFLAPGIHLKKPDFQISIPENRTSRNPFQ
jgi:hypothetical protein